MNLKEALATGALQWITPDAKLTSKELTEARYDLEKAEEQLSQERLDDFRAALSARQDADYHYSYASDTAKHPISAAGEFLDEIERKVG